MRGGKGALVIQHKAKLSDRNLVKEVARNPYYQYFIGLGGYQTKCPFGPQDFSLLNEAREKLDGMIDRLHAMVDVPRRGGTKSAPSAKSIL